MKKIYPVLAGLLLVSFFPLLADATTIKRTGTSVSLASDEVVEGNFYAVGNSVAITGEVSGDVVIAGGNVTSTGSIGEDALIVGGTVSVGGEIADDVRVMAGEVTISGAIQGSLSVLAGRVKILSTATIGGDVMIYGGTALIEGEIGGFLYGTTDSMRIDGTVVSGVDITTQNLQLGNRSAIEGNITYVSNRDLVRGSEAQVGGNIVRNSPTVTESVFSFRPLVINFLIILFTTLVFYLIARTAVERFVAHPMFNHHAVLKAVLLGFVFLFLPVAIAVLLASVLGALVGAVAILIYLLLLLLAIPTMSFVVAKLVMKAFKHKQLTLLHLILAVAIIVSLAYVPVFGFLFLIGLYVFTLGVILSLIILRIRK
ncbi:MAG: polymer-forming cytoskeletal protein [Candidatus Paceibacteria bacterium]